ncbi:hypothetical protein [Nostoc sp.]|uniref:hypothetical protein n=1 Tax=Nostoc sp. TaxID=1180 RepID=UPI002FEE6BFF
MTELIIYAVTFTSKPSEPVSKPIPSKSTLGLTEQLKIADAALPGAVTHPHSLRLCRTCTANLVYLWLCNVAVSQKTYD